ncbi:MAG: BTAD domain-containing putative transcriptional regulator [Bacteroidota bacterium]
MTTHQTLVVGRSLSCVEAIQQLLSSFTQIIPVSRLADLEENKLKSTSLVILLHDLPEENGIARLKTLKTIFPKSHAVLVGMEIASEDVIQAFRLGAKDVCTLDDKIDFINRLKLIIQQTKSIFKPKRIQSVINSILFPEDFLGIVADATPFSSAPFHHFPSADLCVQVFGSFKVFINGATISHPLPNKARALLLYLLLHKKVPRKRLLQLFWRGQIEEYARNSLNVTLYTIRKWFESVDAETQYIICRNDYCEINQNLRIETDHQQFSTAYQKARIVEREQDKLATLNAYFKAYANYRGDFAENISKDDWVESERDSLRENFLQILSRCCQLFLEEERYTIVMNIAKKMLKIDNCLENVHRDLMFVYWKTGNRQRAIRQFNTCKTILKQELNIEPSQKTIMLLKKITG